MEEFLNLTYWRNTVSDYIIAFGSILLAWIVLRLAKGQLIRLLKKLTEKTVTEFDNLLVKAVEKFIIPYLYLATNYHILHQLTLTRRVTKILSAAMLVISIWYAIRLIIFLMHGVVLAYMKQKKEPPERVRQLNRILLIANVIIWIFGLVLIIDNLGYNVKTIIAGLGVGGIAVALAAQNILGDLFSYLVIFFDRPFEVGDFITTNGNSGTVEKIGIKTSLIRSLDGQLMVMPNAEMVKSVIHNYKSLQRRRVVFTFGVVFSTTSAQLKQIPTMIREIITAQEQTTFDRAHFKSFGESSLNFEIAYYIDNPDYLLYMDTHQAICLRIFEVFESEKIDFAFPTRTLYVQSEGSVLTN